MNLASNIEFLAALSEHNNKPWMDANKKWYEQEREKLVEFTQTLLNKMSTIDPAFGALLPKSCLFRINRDVRFSKDKSPYKTNFGIHLNPEGKKGTKGGFYVHISNGDSFIGGGIWMPEAENLKKIRQEIDYNWSEFVSLINNKKFVKTFGALNDYEKLSRPPKGYEADNPAIEYLKLKSFTATQIRTNKEMSDKNIIEQCMDNFQTLHPLLKFLNRTFD